MTIIFGLLLLDFIVFFHELGHFAAARACGVTVESFSIGMGPVIFHHKWIGTDWRVSLFPVGGYCSMKGENDFKNACEARLDKITGDTDSMYGKHPLCRLCIAAAGPAANFIFAIIAYTIIALTGYTYYAANAQIRLADEVYPELHSAARDAGLKTGDLVTEINGKKIEDFSELYEEVSTHPDENLHFTVNRDGKTVSFIVHTLLDPTTGAGKIGVLSNPDTVVPREAPRYSFFPAIFHGTKETVSMLVLSIKSIGTLFKGVHVTDAVSGPVRITTMLGTTAKDGFSEGIRTGFVSVFQFMALISISLFIMNLLPIPILDGGLVLFSLIEAVFKTSIPPRVRLVVQYIGLLFIIMLFVIAAAGDIHYFTENFHAR